MEISRLIGSIHILCLKTVGNQQNSFTAPTPLHLPCSKYISLTTQKKFFGSTSPHREGRKKTTTFILVVCGLGSTATPLGVQRSLAGRTSRELIQHFLFLGGRLLGDASLVGVLHFLGDLLGGLDAVGVHDGRVQLGLGLAEVLAAQEFLLDL